MESNYIINRHFKVKFAQNKTFVNITFETEKIKENENTRNSFEFTHYPFCIQF